MDCRDEPGNDSQQGMAWGDGINNPGRINGLQPPQPMSVAVL
jgi:hypothetical protein